MSYTLREYLSILADHVDAHLRTTRKDQSLLTSRPPVRASKAGTQRRPWRDVKAVRRYRRGYLLEFAGHGMPVPCRCLDALQAARLRALFAKRTR